MSHTRADLQTRGGESLDAIDPASLARMSLAELDAIFADLDPATLSQLQGHKRGRLLAVAGLDWLPPSLRGALMSAIDRLPLWRGETVDGEFGANAWLLPGRQLEFGRYLLREAPANDGSGPVIRLDYDVTANPKPLRRISAELRLLAPGLFLARVHIPWRDKERRVSYFALEG